MSKKTLNKRDMKALEDAAKELEQSAADAFAAHWYFERDAFKGHSWGHAARRKLQSSIKTMLRLFPDDND